MGANEPLESALVEVAEARFSMKAHSTLKKSGNVEVKKDITPFWEEVGEVMRLMVSPRMRILLPQIIWTGISLATYTGLMIPIIAETLPNDSTNDQFQKAMFAMTALGVGEMMGGFFIGFIIDKVGNRAAVYSNLVLIVIQTVFMLLYLYSNTFGWLAFAMTFTWGFQDSANCTHTSEMVAFEFDDSP